MGGDVTDDDLLTAARGGNRAAVEALLARHQARVYRFSLKMCRDPADASDVLQETLIALARSVREVRGTSALSTWLYAVARSFCIKKRRRSKFAPDATESLERDAARAAGVPDERPAPDASLAAQEVEAALNAALQSLSEEHREVVLLRDGEGLTAPEVAQVLGISTDAVKSRLHRARVALRAELLPRLGEAAPASARPPGCPDILTTYSRRLEGEVSADLCRQMEQHLAGCRHCTDACDSLKRSLAICSAAPAKSVPPAVQEALRKALGDVLASLG